MINERYRTSIVMKAARREDMELRIASLFFYEQKEQYQIYQVYRQSEEQTDRDNIDDLEFNKKFFEKEKEQKARKYRCAYKYNK